LTAVVPELNNTIIYLIGVPAVGKYTTARAIARFTGAKLVDNHLINNPIFSVGRYDGTDRLPFPRGGWKYTGRIRRAVLAFIREFGHPDESYIFTNVLASDETGAFGQIERLARSRRALFVPVWLKCSARELKKRKATPQRRKMMKEVELSNIRYWTKEFRELDVAHSNRLDIDNSHLKPAQTARLILEHIRMLQGGS
jgi:shikimate kinase